MKHLPYHKIPQFKDIIKTIIHKERFQGVDDNGDPIYNDFVKLPILKFHGTVKLHGTNAAVCYNNKEGLWIQSRQQIKTDGFFGFPLFVNKNKDTFLYYIRDIAKEFELDLNTCTISIYGEWAGKNIQTRVAISEFDPSFFIFDIKVSPCCNGKQFEPYWLNFEEVPDLAYDNIYMIDEFKNYSVTIDFNDFEKIYDHILTLTEEVEKECPVAKALGVSGIGEGIVWKCEYKGERIIFKSKGEKHSNTGGRKSKVEFSTEKNEKIEQFVNNVVTENRVKQAIFEVKQQNELDEITIKNTGQILAWVGNDIKIEEANTLLELELDWKEVSGKVNETTRKIFFKLI